MFTIPPPRPTGAALNLAEFQEAYGLLDDSWKSIAIGKFSQDQQWAMTDAIARRISLMPDRSAMLVLSWGTAAAHLPNMAKAYLLETKVVLDRSSFLPCPLNRELPYKNLMYQAYTSSYFYKWCQSSGEGVENLLVGILDRVANQRVDRLRDFEPLSEHLGILTHLLAYLPKTPFPFPHLLPPTSSPSSDPAPHTQRLENAILILLRLDEICHDPQTAAEYNQHVAQHMQRAIGEVLPFLVSRGKEPITAVFSGEDWHICAAGSLDVGMHLSTKQECGRCRSVWYCNPAHQKRHWNGTNLLDRNYAHKPHCFKNDL